MSDSFLIKQRLSRRTFVKGLAVLALALSDWGCASSGSSSTPRPTASPRPVGSLILTYRGHSDRVTAVGWSPDGKWIASGSLDRTVQVWNATTGRHRATFGGHSDSVTCVAWSPDGKWVASGSLDKSVQVWDAATGGHSFTYQGHSDGVLTLAWSPDGKWVASGSLDRTVQVWDAMSGTHFFTYHGHTQQVTTLGWSPDGKRIASGSLDKTIQIWNAMTGEQAFTYHGHTDGVLTLTWSPDGKWVASGSLDKTAQVWNGMTGDVLYTYRGYNVEAARRDPSKGVLPDVILALAWSHNGKRLAAVTQVYCGDECGVVVMWDALTENHVSFYVDVPVFALEWSPDDKRFVTGAGLSLAQITQAS